MTPAGSVPRNELGDVTDDNLYYPMFNNRIHKFSLVYATPANNQQHWSPVVTKYNSLRRAQPYSLYSCYSESKLSIWSDTHIYTFSIYLESSPSFCICSRMFTPLHNYLDHSSVHGVKTMSRLRAIYRRRRQDQRLCMPRWFHQLTIRQVLEYSRYNTMINTHQTI